MDIPDLHTGMLHLSINLSKGNMRYNESEANKKAPKKEKKEIPVKAGTKEYDYYNLSSANKKPCLLYTSPSPRDRQKSRMPSSA